NHNAESALGHHPGYMLMPEGSYVHPMLAADDPPVRRNSYLHYQLSVTQLAPAERYAGGRFAMTSAGSDTLASCTARDRPVCNPHISVSTTCGFNYIHARKHLP